MRRYNGKHVVRKGWRMQDRRVLPGSTDYYVHDEDGRPVFRVPVTSHDSLTAWLQPIANRLRKGLGDDARILLAFDRGGAFSSELAGLRDAGIEFVTYERSPYPMIAVSKFDDTVVVRGEAYQLHESRNKNLGKKRGRLRRIAVRTPDGKQINVVAISAAPAAQLIAILLGGEAHAGASTNSMTASSSPTHQERSSPTPLDGDSIGRCVSLESPREMPAASSRVRNLRWARYAEARLSRNLSTHSNSSAISKRSDHRPRPTRPSKRPLLRASSSATQVNSRPSST
jgi:hypothetical protein